jgi:alanine racemase
MQRATRREVRLDNLKANYVSIRSHIGDRPEIFGVVKANGYGHGAVEVSRALLEAGCRRLAVATPDEALELREAGLEAPVLVLGPSPERSVVEFVRLGIASAVTDLHFAKALGAEATRQGRPAAVHVKVDSGMGRIGFLPKDIPDVLDELLTIPGLDIEGMFTHFAVADETRLDYTDYQFAGLQQSLRAAAERGIRLALRHACNSAGILACPDKYLDAVRPGIILYGMWPSDECPRPIELKPTFEIKTEVAFVKELPPCSGVGYGLRYMTRGVEEIAVLPVGYADGYSRALSMKVPVLVKGRRVPIRGNICMDQTMIDVTGLGVKVGDEVVLIGRQGDEAITPEEIGAARNTINYEVPNAFLKRVPRVYIS